MIRKLNVLYDYKALEQLRQSDDLTKIQKLSDAIQNKKQVILKNCRSFNSNKITDRKVEPFDYLPDFPSVWSYEYESKSCKQFKLARMSQIEIIQKYWGDELLHRLSFTDAFRISAPKPDGKVSALLSLKAYNLLIEEYRLSKEFITQEDKGYELDIPVAGFNGIGRFVKACRERSKFQEAMHLKNF